jgi:hypothetical protein
VTAPFPDDDPMLPAPQITQSDEPSRWLLTLICLGVVASVAIGLLPASLLFVAIVREIVGR